MKINVDIGDVLERPIIKLLRLSKNIIVNYVMNGLLVSFIILVVQYPPYNAETDAEIVIKVKKDEKFYDKMIGLQYHPSHNNYR